MLSRTNCPGTSHAVATPRRCRNRLDASAGLRKTGAAPRDELGAKRACFFDSPGRRAQQRLGGARLVLGFLRGLRAPLREHVWSAAATESRKAPIFLRSDAARKSCERARTTERSDSQTMPRASAGTKEPRSPDMAAGPESDIQRNVLLHVAHNSTAISGRQNPLCSAKRLPESPACLLRAMIVCRSSAIRVEPASIRTTPRIAFRKIGRSPRCSAGGERAQARGIHKCHSTPQPGRR